MARLLYLDCFSGISGDMVLGAMLDAGLPLEVLRDAIGSLPVPGLAVASARVLRAGVSATKFIVCEPGPGSTGAQHSRPHSHDRGATHHDHPHEHPHGHGHDHEPVHDHHDDEHGHRSLPEIYRLIDGSRLPAAARDRAKALFERLGKVEAAIHQTPLESVHLHEVGAIDSIVDIVGAVCALEWLKADRIVCSPLNVGGGTVRSAHGIFPVPAPATVALLGDAPIYSGSQQYELVTPTGALIATSYASSFGGIPPMTVERVGYGAGDRDPLDTPNVLRVLIGNEVPRPATERVTVVECEIDDMNPQIFGVLMDRLYAAGALEVFYVPVQMKKNRPGTLLTVIVSPERRTALTDIVFAETTTIGLRYHEVERECLRREIVSVETPFGAVRFKIAWQGDRLANASPEFDDCVRLASDQSLPVKEVQAAAVDAFRRRSHRS